MSSRIPSEIPMNIPRPLEPQAVGVPEGGHLQDDLADRWVQGRLWATNANDNFKSNAYQQLTAFDITHLTPYI